MQTSRQLKKQYRGTAILDTTEGILVNATGGGNYLLPGGAADRKKGESRLEAAVRELREETGLYAYMAIELFEYVPPPFTKKNFQDYHKVFYVKAKGNAKPGQEVKYLGYYNTGTEFINDRPISQIHRKIIEQYYEMRGLNPELFRVLDERSR